MTAYEAVVIKRAEARNYEKKNNSFKMYPSS